ncbi:MAG: HAMP domain-containing protein [Boseongicola sp. SB0677_bin_26]|nr:HAMP domain-containing protein [Boseongicola sp. SB0665_bin_10]MYG27061.1 HAMP domain-containing protein [Boseongicola sp. SB0677_bin_26]
MMADPAARARISGSLRFRLAAGIILVLAIGGVAVAYAAFTYGRDAAQQSFDRLLVGAANQVAGALRLRDGEVVVDIPISAFELLSLAPRDRVVYGVFGDDGTLITGYDIPSPPDGDGMFFTGSFAGEAARFVRVTRQFSERSFLGSVDVIIGQTTEARRELAQQITRNTLIAVAAIGVGMAALAALAVQSALSPLHRIERDIAARSSKDLTPVDVNVPREISSLVHALNRFIARIERQLHVMRTLIADASHQLRTPIAALRAQAELAAEEPDQERTLKIVGRIHERSRNLSRLTDQLLSHALIIHRADTVDLEALDLRTVATEAVDQTDQSMPDVDRAIRLVLPEAPVMCDGDRLSLAEACKNLINNALNHGRSPISVFVQGREGHARIGVRDGGTGIPEAMWRNAGSRFAKDAGVSVKGAGLGLAIVNAVSEAHGGQMRMERPSEAAFEVSLELPLLSEDAE